MESSLSIEKVKATRSSGDQEVKGFFSKLARSVLYTRVEAATPQHP
jgi:hypothetical protein